LQVKARPPTFVVWISGSTPLSVPSQRFLAGQIRRQFGFGGVPLRIVVRHKPPRKQRGRK
jgi:GTP-binding protein